ncbi:MAG: HDOD domain-containing protein [Myxococcales bacterium]|nr:HDOD domain-containing protein [Myxococcales bacterium]
MNVAQRAQGEGEPGGASPRRLLLVTKEVPVLAPSNTPITELAGYDVRVARSSGEALRALCADEFAAVVCALGDPRLDAAVLKACRARRATVPRILVLGHDDLGRALDAGQSAHHVVAEPLSGPGLEQVLDRCTGGIGCIPISRLRSVLPHDVQLPSMPGSASELLAALEDESKDLSHIVDILEADPALAVSTLRLANSPYFMLTREVSSLKHAAALLGTNALRAVALAGLCFSSVSGIDSVLIERVRHRGLAAAQLVRTVAGAHADDALTSAILQDIGQLVLCQAGPTAYAQLLQASEAQSLPIEQLELQQLEITHAEVGAALLAHWGMPDRTIRSVAFSHLAYPLPARGLDQTAVLFVVGALMAEVELCAVQDRLLHPDWLERMGISEAQVDEWRAAAADLSIHMPAM